MNDYLFIEFNDESTDYVNEVKDVLLQYVKASYSNMNAYLNDVYGELWENIEHWQTRLIIAIDGVKVVGVVGFSSKMYHLNHRIIKYMYVIPEYNGKNVEEQLLDNMGKHLNNNKLSVINKGECYETFINSGFVDSKLVNKDHLVLLFRNNNSEILTKDLDGTKYYKKNKDYLRNYKLLFSGYLFFFTIVFLSVSFLTIAHFANDEFNMFASYISLIIIGFTAIVGIPFSIFYKRFKINGEKELGFLYSPQNTGVNEFKFNNKFNEFIVAAVTGLHSNNITY